MLDRPIIYFKNIQLVNYGKPKQLRWQSLAVIIGLIATIWLNAGCATTPAAVSVDQIPGFLELRENPRSSNFSPLKNRRIVLDPGHGGFFNGATGPGGLTEASVNLGVALYLRGMLEWAGAEVHMTRTADYDFLSPADSTLAGDLAWRVNFADQIQPDVFLSIHHNSTASQDPDINETQTYYPLNDAGASLDLARAIHRHLVLNLEISPAKILPGNFHVLRNSTVPSVLGEPAMLSNPVIEDRLTLAASQQLEASAYFMGLLDYFSAGTPIWSGAAVDTVQISDLNLPTTVSWTFLPAGLPKTSSNEPVSTDSTQTAAITMAPAPDPATFTLTANNQPRPVRLSPDGYTVSWTIPAELAHQSVWLEISGRNLRGRATSPRKTLIQPPATSEIISGLTTLLTSEVTATGQTDICLLQWTYRSGESNTGRLFIGEKNTVEIVGGQSGWLLVDGIPELFFCRTSAGEIISEPVSIRPKIDSLPAGWSWHLLTETANNGDLTTFLPLGSWQNKTRNVASTLPARFHLTGTPAVATRNDAPLWLECPGILPLIQPASIGNEINDHLLTGTVNRLERNWHVQKLLPSLIGKTVVLDPIGGGTVTNLTAPLGLRGSDLNLAAAVWAGRLLRAAGANVYLTRTDESFLRGEEKVRLAGKVGADMFLTIGRTSGYAGITARHHPGSIVGTAWANSFIEAYGPLSGPISGQLPTGTITPAYDYVLRHTACPAVSVRLPFPTDVETEMYVSNPAFAQAEARAILLSIAAVTAGPEILRGPLKPSNILTQLPAIMLPQNDIERIVIDGNFGWVPLPTVDPTLHQKSVYVNSIGDPGFPSAHTRHTIEIHAGKQWQVWLMEAGPGGNNFSLLLHN